MPHGHSSHSSHSSHHTSHISHTSHTSHFGHSTIGHSHIGHSHIGVSHIGHSQIGCHSHIGPSHIGHTGIHHSTFHTYHGFMRNRWQSHPHSFKKHYARPTFQARIISPTETRIPSMLAASLHLFNYHNKKQFAAKLLPTLIVDPSLKQEELLSTSPTSEDNIKTFLSAVKQPTYLPLSNTTKFVFKSFVGHEVPIKLELSCLIYDTNANYVGRIHQKPFIPGITPNPLYPEMGIDFKSIPKNVGTILIIGQNKDTLPAHQKLHFGMMYFLNITVNGMVPEGIPFTNPVDIDTSTFNSQPFLMGKIFRVKDTWSFANYGQVPASNEMDCFNTFVTPEAHDFLNTVEQTYAQRTPTSYAVFGNNLKFEVKETAPDDLSLDIAGLTAWYYKDIPPASCEVEIQQYYFKENGTIFKVDDDEDLILPTKGEKGDRIAIVGKVEGASIFDPSSMLAALSKGVKPDKATLNLIVESMQPTLNSPFGAELGKCSIVNVPTTGTSTVIWMTIDWKEDSQSWVITPIKTTLLNVDNNAILLNAVRQALNIPVPQHQQVNSTELQSTGVEFDLDLSTHYLAISNETTNIFTKLEYSLHNRLIENIPYKDENLEFEGYQLPQIGATPTNPNAPTSPTPNTNAPTTATDNSTAAPTTTEPQTINLEKTVDQSSSTTTPQTQQTPAPAPQQPPQPTAPPALKLSPLQNLIAFLDQDISAITHSHSYELHGILEQQGQGTASLTDVAQKVGVFSMAILSKGGFAPGSVLKIEIVDRKTNNVSKSFFTKINQTIPNATLAVIKFKNIKEDENKHGKKDPAPTENHIKDIATVKFFDGATFDALKMIGNPPKALKITVIQAKDITNRDVISKSTDPYFRLMNNPDANSNKKKIDFKSNALQKTSNPNWNQSFEFKYPFVGHIFKVKVYDKNMLIDDSLGQAILHINRIPFEKSTFWIKLEPTSKLFSVTGEVQITTEWQW